MMFGSFLNRIVIMLNRVRLHYGLAELSPRAGAPKNDWVICKIDSQNQLHMTISNK